MTSHLWILIHQNHIEPGSLPLLVCAHYVGSGIQCFFWLFGQDEMVATHIFCQLIFWRY
jgi:hypothetical protein